jgi:hypothetical protein
MLLNRRKGVRQRDRDEETKSQHTDAKDENDF